MKVLQRLRSRRSSKASKNKMKTSDLASPSDTSSLSSWGNESNLSLTASGRDPLFLVTRFNSSDADTATDASSLPPAVDDLNDDPSPMNWGNSAVTLRRGSATSMVIYSRPSSPLPLPDSICTWLNAADALVRSREMQMLIGSSRDVLVSAVATSGNVALSAGGFVVDAALLPVTLPLHVLCTSTRIVAGVTGGVINKAIGKEEESREQEDQIETLVGSFIHNAINFVPFIMNTAGNLTHEVGSAILGAPQKTSTTARQSTRRVPLSPIKEISAGETTSEREEMLQRLRLDFQQSTSTKETHDVKFSRATRSDISKFLLRVDDIIVMVSPDPTASESIAPRRAVYVDIGSEFAEESVTTDALEQLIQRGLDITATNAGAHLNLPGFQCNTSIRVDWKPERDTSRLVKKMAQQDQSGFYSRLNQHVLVWSGKYHGPKYFGSENPLFLARGIVRKSPRDFFEMLWDSSRTGEYNNFSLGRFDTLVIDDSISGTGTSGAKVIKSDTRVPFAGINITLTALMHAKKLSEVGGEGYVIVSRSLSCGTAGCHIGSSKCVDKSNKNEILLGVNIMRPVPGHPDLCDLMSVSQVSSTMVPQFLAFRIGMMGLEDFFANVRKAQ